MNEQIALSLVQEDYDESEYEPIKECVKDGYYKHDSLCYYSIFLRKFDMTYWQVNYTISYKYGLDDNNISYHQVEKKEVVTTTWEAKR